MVGGLTTIMMLTSSCTFDSDLSGLVSADAGGIGTDTAAISSDGGGSDPRDTTTTTEDTALGGSDSSPSDTSATDTATDTTATSDTSVTADTTVAMDTATDLPTDSDMLQDTSDTGAMADTTPEDTAPADDTRPPLEPQPWWGEPITTEADTWVWVDFPNTKCADGSPTGLGINVHPGADKALIYYEGGGACWDYGSCTGVSSAIHLDGFTEETFNGLLTDVYLQSLVFDRNDDRNPLREAHMVFVPYCTADVFFGDRVAQLQGFFPWEETTIHFNGYPNVQRYLERLVPTFQDVERVVLSGSSAGGFGAALTWSLVQERFASIPVDVLDDSGPPINPGGDRWNEWLEAWNGRLPADCETCDESVIDMRNHIFDALLADGTRRFGLMSYNRDSVISAFFGVFPFVFDERLMEMCHALEAYPNAQCYVLDGRLHTLLVAGVEGIEADDGTPVWRWLEQAVEGDPSWTSHTP